MRSLGSLAPRSSWYTRLMVGLGDLATWIDAVGALLLAVGWVVVGAVVARSAHPSAGWALAAAGVVDLLVTCCSRTLAVAPRIGFGGAEGATWVGIALRLLGLLDGALLLGAIAFATSALGNALATRAAEGVG